jgi:site-specific recombinase XerD
VAAKVLSFAVEPVGIAEASAAFLAERDLARASRRVYALTLARLEKALGSGFAVAELDGVAVKEFLRLAYPKVSPATWNRNLATIKSFCAYCRRQGWMVVDPTEVVERRRVSRDETKALPFEELEALWSRRNVPVREKALWRLLYDTAARANEVLSQQRRRRRSAQPPGPGGVQGWGHRVGALRLRLRPPAAPPDP